MTYLFFFDGITKINNKELISNIYGYVRFGKIWNALTSYPSSTAVDTATSICAPYGITPWKIQENVSRIDAALLEEIP